VEERITAFQIGDNEETDTVCVEVLLMKLALAELVINEMASYIDKVDENYGVSPDDVSPPNGWAISGAIASLDAVSHALRCGCWGHKEAYMHSYG